MQLAPKKLVIMSHLGRPKPGQKSLSLEPVQEYLEPLLGETIFLAGSIAQAQASKQRIVLLENIRSFSGETENSLEFAQEKEKATLDTMGGPGPTAPRPPGKHHACQEDDPSRQTGSLPLPKSKIQRWLTSAATNRGLAG